MKKKHPNKQYKINVGENILYWRRLKGLKQEDLAARIGISTPALSNIENSISKPDIERLEDIADALEIDVALLLQNPRQIVSVNNSLPGSSVVQGNGSITYTDNYLLHRLTAAMEKISGYFSTERK